MKILAVSGHCIATPPPLDWREQLTLMLGARPRRIGTWAELGLYGALRCMADADESTLPNGAQIWLGSCRGTFAATAIVLEQSRVDLPMPLAFLQTQPSQLLALLAVQLKWKGNACFVAGVEPQSVLQLAAAQTGIEGMLFGWVDEMDGGSTNWLRLHHTASDENSVSVPATEMFSASLAQKYIVATGLRASNPGSASL